MTRLDDGTAPTCIGEDNQMELRRSPQRRSTTLRTELRRCEIGELRVPAQERQLRHAGRTVAVLGEDDLCDSLLVGLLAEVVLVAVDEEDEVGVLLQAAALSQVGEDRTLVVALL